MAISDLEPEGFSPEMRTFSDFTRPWRIYTQGFALREVGVWLRIDGAQTLLGFGTANEALAEAEAALSDALSKLRAEIARRGAT